MGWLIALGILLFLALLPIGICVCYDQIGLQLGALFGLIRFQLFPGKSNPKEKHYKKEKKPHAASRAPKNNAQKKNNGGSLAKFCPLLQVAVRFLNSFRKKLIVSRFHFNLILAADDPADLAMHYASGWGIVGEIMPIIENLFTIKKRDIQVQCDFTAEETRLFLNMRIVMPLAILLGLIIRYGIQTLWEYFKIK